VTLLLTALRWGQTYNPVTVTALVPVDLTFVVLPS